MEDSKKSKLRSKIGLVVKSNVHVLSFLRHKLFKGSCPLFKPCKSRRKINQYAKQTTPSLTSVLGAQTGDGLCHWEFSVPVFQIV